jgi:hypothetical protein
VGRLLESAQKNLQQLLVPATPLMRALMNLQPPKALAMMPLPAPLNALPRLALVMARAPVTRHATASTFARLASPGASFEAVHGASQAKAIAVTRLAEIAVLASARRSRQLHWQGPAPCDAEWLR